MVVRAETATIDKSSAHGEEGPAQGFAP
jgi:hypothetical protein